MTILDLHPRSGQGVYVYEFPVRLWHWTMAACIFTLFVSGYYIEYPSFGSDMDNIVRIHLTAGLILCVAMLCRVIWAFFGNVVSRQIFILKIWQKAWWKGLWDNIRWYAFMTNDPDVRMGHNPLAQAAMFCIILVIFFMCFSGLGLYQAKDPTPIIGWFSFMIDFSYWLGGNGLDLVVMHRLGMILIVCFVMIHLYMVIRESIMGKTTMIYTMVSGNRLVLDRPAITRRMLKAEEKTKNDAITTAPDVEEGEWLKCFKELFSPLPEEYKGKRQKH